MENVNRIELNATKIPHPPHPYYPLGIEIVGYLANEWSTLHLLLTFFSGCAVIFTVTTLLVKKVRPNLPQSELLTLLWFVLCTSTFAKLPTSYQTKTKI